MAAGLVSCFLELVAFGFQTPFGSS